MTFRRLLTPLTRRTVGAAVAVVLLLLPATAAHALTTVGWQNPDLQVTNWIHDHDEQVTAGDTLRAAWAVQNTSNDSYTVDVNYVIWDPNGSLFYSESLQIVLNPSDVFANPVSKPIGAGDPTGRYTVSVKATNVNGTSHAINYFKVY